MQNSQPNRKVTPKSPRRARRGALMPAALLAVLLITILMSQFAQAQLRRASAARSEARAGQLAAIAADFDYYVHAKRDDLNISLSDASLSDRALFDWERAAFEQDFLRIGVARQIHGFDLEYLISRGQDGADVFGALRLSALDERGRAEMCTIIARLARHGAQDQGPTNTDSTGGTGTAGGCDTETSSDHLILTAPLSGLNTAWVLREPRAGHPPPKLIGAGALDLGGHNLVNVGSLTATGDDENAAANEDERPATRVVGTLRAREMTGTLGSVRRNPDLDESDETGNVEIAGTTRVAEAFSVEGTLTSGEISGLPSDSSPGDVGHVAMRIDEIILIFKSLNTNTFSAFGLIGTDLTTPRIVISGAATVRDQLTTEALQSPAVSVSGEFTARQIFTKEAEVVNLDIRGICHGC